MKVILGQVLLVLLLSGWGVAASANATIKGTISVFFTHGDGRVALKVTQGFSDAENAECPTNNGYAGTDGSSDSILKSTLLAAFMAQKPVRITVSGCAGNWLSIVSVFVDET